MTLIDLLLQGLSLLFVVLGIWAVIDAAIRPAQAFPAIGRLTKLIWLIGLGFSILFVGLTYLLGFLAIVGVVIILVYHLDVRPRIKEITGR